MKHFLLVNLFILAIAGIKAQNTNLIFFTEQGERFSVVLNGVLQNEQPETNIKVTDLPAPNYKVKIIFEDKKLADLDKNLFFNQGTESTFCIRKNNKNQYVVRYLNEVPISESLRPVQAQKVIVYHPDPIIQTSTTTTTTTNNNPGGAGVGINVNDPYSGSNMNINLNIGGVGSQTSTTTTTTTTTTGSNNGIHEEHEYQSVNDPYQENPSNREQSRYILPGYNGVYGCPYPMMPADFEQAKQSIGSKSFEDSKLTIAKQIINTNCLLSAQVKEIMLLFSFEDTRLELAKYCYGYTLDIGNYYRVNDAFTFESSIDELNKYIAGFRR